VQPGTPAAAAAPPGLPIAKPNVLGAPGAQPAAGGVPGGEPGAATEGPTGEGWIIQLKGYHYHNSLESGEEEGAQYLVTTLLKELQSGRVDLPVAQGPGKPPLMKSVPITELGISYPVITQEKKIEAETREDPALENDPNVDVKDRSVHLRRYDFVVQFCWQETPPSKRLANEEAARAAMPGAVPPQPETPQ
jgi:type IV pilus assembly protein PilM